MLWYLIIIHLLVAFITYKWINRNNKEFGIFNRFDKIFFALCWEIFIPIYLLDKLERYI